MCEPLTILNLPFWDISPADLAENVLAYSQKEGGYSVNYLNPHACVLARKHQDFAEALRHSSLTWCDGQGIVLGSRLLGKCVEHRWTLPDHFDMLLSRLEHAGVSTFFIGETRKNMEAFVEKVRLRHPNLCVLGGHHGFFDGNGSESERLMNRLRQDSPEVIFIGMGMPRQELLGARIAKELNKGVAFSVGALFLYYAGLEKRCPSFYTRHGLEWLYRLGRNPRRYFHRYVLESARFVFLVLRERRGLLVT